MYMLIINLNSDSQLSLTCSEALKLAEILESQLQTAREIVIADVRLTVEEGWRVLRSIEKAVKVDWKIEGF
jgi:hypothetical protein